jgi:outer membrane protein, multidrug efflux system
VPPFRFPTSLTRHGLIASLVSCSAALTLLGGCMNTAAPKAAASEVRAELTPPAPWSVPINATQDPSIATRPAHDGQVASIARWWQHFDDPLLAALIDDAQASSPAALGALARVREARAQSQAAAGALFPSLGVGLDGARAKSAANPAGPITQATFGLQSQWEVDLFGGAAHRAQAASARAEQSRLEWHEARVTLAAELANTYLTLRACESVASVLDMAAQSQRKSAELTREKVRVGFEAPAVGALALASAADASNRLLAQRADCESLVLALSTLSGRSTAALRTSLAERQGQLPRPGQRFDVDQVPSSVLAHRPDVAAQEQALVATEHDIAGAQAQRWPRLTFSGSLGGGLVRLGGQTTDGAAWSIVPSVVLPILDGGRIAAGIDAAVARRYAAVAALDARIRQAVKEIEEALVRLAAARARESDALQAAEGFKTYFEATEQRWRIGAGSLIEMEEARRLALNAQAALIGLQRERVATWIALYRATGGGWQPDEANAALPGAPRERRRR